MSAAAAGRKTARVTRCDLESSSEPRPKEFLSMGHVRSRQDADQAQRRGRIAKGSSHSLAASAAAPCYAALRQETRFQLASDMLSQ